MRYKTRSQPNQPHTFDRTMANSFTFVSLTIMLLSCVCYSSSSYCDDYCNSWETWSPWNMDCACGVKDVSRIRTRGCNSIHFPLHVYWSIFYTCDYDKDRCEPLCYNGGTFNYKEDRCDCSERFAGKCCKEGKSKKTYVYLTIQL